MGILNSGKKKRPGRTGRPARHSVRPQVEALEERAVPYAASGNLWPHPGLVTLSFEPDGTNLGGPSSNLVSTFNRRFGSASAWQNVILKAAQTWAVQTNLNFSVVADNGSGSGTGPDQQGDPKMGDIRIGGFNFNNSGLLALADMPPSVNNYSIAGDIALNTGQPFNVNGLDYDLYTVALHELGHALGMGHSLDSNAVMSPVYTDPVSGLGTDDIAGIRSVYGGSRAPDRYDAAGSNGSLATASDLTPQLDPTTLAAAVTGFDVSSTSDVDFYKVTAPAGGSGTLTVTAQSKGLSLLAPSLKIYNASGSLLGSLSASGSTGGTLTWTGTVTPGQQYYLRVAGANSSVFGVGAYGLALNFGTGSTPAITPSSTTTPDGSPLNGGGGIADRTDSGGHSVRDILDSDGQDNGHGHEHGHGDRDGGSGATAPDLPFGDALGIPSPGAGVSAVPGNVWQQGWDRLFADLGWLAF